MGILLWLLACSDQGLVVQPPHLRVEPALVDFGTLPPGTASVQTFTVTNDGPGRLSVDDIVLEGGSFTLPSLPALGELRPGESRTIDVAWTATAAPESALARVEVTGTNGAIVPIVGAPLDTGDGSPPLPEGDSVADGEVLIPPEGGVATGEFVLAGGVDLAFLLDTTQSMQSLVTAVADELDAIAVALAADDLDVRFGLATYEDYPVVPYGSPGVDLPFVLRSSITDDLTSVRAALDAVVIHQGQDAPEASLEAIYQGLTGNGWDLGCDGRYDPREDVPPWAPRPDDAFGGTAAGAGTGDPEGRGGFGFGPGRVPVILYATNYELRDADDPVRYGTPGGCPDDAGMTSVATASHDLGARLVGVGVNVAERGHTITQMQALAERTGSVADLDGDGRVEPAALRWTGNSTAFRGEVVRGVREILGAMRWPVVELRIDDPAGLVRAATPTRWEDVRAGDRLSWRLDLRALPAEAEATIRVDLVAPTWAGHPEELLGTQTFTVRASE